MITRFSILLQFCFRIQLAPLHLDNDNGDDLAGGSGDPREPVDASLPGHRLRCTPHTYAGGVSNVTHADFYEFPVDIEKAASVEKIVASGLLTPAPGHYVCPGRAVQDDTFKPVFHAPVISALEIMI
jgi:hypothetical protein